MLYDTYNAAVKSLTRECTQTAYSMLYGGLMTMLCFATEVSGRSEANPEQILSKRVENSLRI